MKSVNVLYVYCLMILFFAGCATIGVGKPGKEGAAAEQFSKVISLTPSSFAEECMKLSPAQTLGYSFGATGNVHFNIHNHVSKGRIYVIKKDSVSIWKGTVDPSQLGGNYDRQIPEFCMLWRNISDSDVRISLEYTITGK